MNGVSAALDRRAYNSWSLTARSLILREGTAPVGERLLTTGFLAALLHGIVLLGVTFGSVTTDTLAPGLEVLIVSEALPESARNDTARYLAQRTQLGSGTTEEPAAATRPMPPQPLPAQPGDADDQTGQQATGDPAESLLASSDPRTEVRYLDAAGQPQSSSPPLILEEQTAPLRGPSREELWITPDTREALLAPYLDGWRHKVERLGTLNFPRAARAAAQANPVLEVAIGADGQLESARIRHSSGSTELDQAALAILGLASPFDPFAPELAAQYRVLRFAYEWQFVGGQIGMGRVTAPADSR